MAIPHMSAQIISRSAGRSSVAAAAYRAAEKLADLRLGKTANFARKQGVVHTEILAPKGAPDWMRDRAPLWNGVEAAERRKDAQVAREMQVALPRELGLDEQVKLLRTYVQTHFVDAGMVADFAVHVDNPNNPHAHIMLTTRGIEGDGFGPKERTWNAKDMLLGWREGWALEVNRALERNGFEQRIDTRSYAAQGIAIEPTPKIGVGEAHGGGDGRDCIAARIAEHDATVRRNGEAILAQPEIALVGITHQRATFTRSDMGRYLHTYTADNTQFQACLSAVMSSPELVRLESEMPHEPERFSTREMLETEQALLQSGQRLAAQYQGHSVSTSHSEEALLDMAPEPQAAAQHVLHSTANIAIVEGFAGAGKSTMLRQASVAWEAAGYRVLGGALSGKAAEGLEISAGVAARSLASWEHSWKQGRDTLKAGDVFVVDEAGMVGTRQMQRLLAAVEQAQAKVVLVGDTQQLQAIEAGAPMRALANSVGHFAMVNIQRQHQVSDRRASVDLGQGDVRAALLHYDDRGAVLAHANQGAVVGAMVDAWDQARRGQADASSIMLAYCRADVRLLNEAARAKRQAAGELGAPHVLQTAQGKRTFAVGDRVYFLRNDRGLGVKNGTLGTLTAVQGSSLQVQVDKTSAADDGREVAFDTRDYPHLEHGYAATVHKAQGVTVDRAYVLASPHFDRHTTYVALTRHREEVQLHYNREDFATVKALESRLARAQAKDMAVDYRTSVAANVAMERPHHIERSFAQHTEHETSRQTHVQEQARSRHDTSLREHGHEQPKWLAAALSQQAAAQREQAHGLQQPTLQARAAGANETGHERSLHEQMQTRTQEPVSRPVGHDTAPALSAEQQGPTQTQTHAQALAGAHAHAACLARIRAHEAEAHSLQVKRNMLSWHAPKSAETFRDKGPAIQAARQECAWAKQEQTWAEQSRDRQDREESAYRQQHPMRAGLGLEEPRHEWAQRRQQITQTQAAAQMRLGAADKALSNLMQDPELTRSCARQAEASRAAYVQRQQDIAARAAQLAERAPHYAADKQSRDKTQSLRAERDVRMDRHQALTHESRQMRSDMQAEPMTLAQAVERQPAVVQARDLYSRAQAAHAAAAQRLQAADTARHRYEAAHPIKAAFGLNDGHGQATSRAIDAYKQTQKQLTQAQYNLDGTRETQATLRGAVQHMDRHNASIEAAKEREGTLSITLERQAPTHRTDCFTREVEKNLDRELQQSKAQERGFGMER